MVCVTCNSRHTLLKPFKWAVRSTISRRSRVERASRSRRHHVASAQTVEQPPQLRPVALRPTNLFLKDVGAAGFAQQGPLLGVVPALGGHAGIADHRAGRWPRGHGLTCRKSYRTFFCSSDKDMRQAPLGPIFQRSSCFSKRISDTASRGKRHPINGRVFYKLCDRQCLVRVEIEWPLSSERLP